MVEPSLLYISDPPSQMMVLTALRLLAVSGVEVELHAIALPPTALLEVNVQFITVKVDSLEQIPPP